MGFTTHVIRVLLYIRRATGALEKHRTKQMNNYSNEVLHADMKSNLRGIVRRAQLLIKVPEEMRSEIVAESNRIMNARQCRPTEALAEAIFYAKVGA